MIGMSVRQSDGGGTERGPEKMAVKNIIVLQPALDVSCLNKAVRGYSPQIRPATI